MSKPTSSRNGTARTSSSGAPLLPAEVAAVQDSFARVAPVADAFAVEFYDRLFHEHPDLRRMFAKDMKAQREKLISTLAVVVSGLGDFARIEGVARDLGARHRGYRVEPAHYQAVGEALLRSLAARLGAQWSQELQQAWVSAYKALSRAMIEGARR